MTLGEKIAYYRILAGMRQVDLAKAAYCAKRNITYYESGYRYPNLQGFALICKALGVTMDQIMEGVTL
jgi:transcriptional regulator with XRE-family HTH domain